MSESRTKEQRTVYQERLPHREAVQRLWRAYGKLLREAMSVADADPLADGRRPESAQECES